MRVQSRKQNLFVVGVQVQELPEAAIQVFVQAAVEQQVLPAGKRALTLVRPEPRGQLEQPGR